MQDIIKTSLNHLFLSIIAASLFAPIMIRFLYLTKQTAYKEKTRLKNTKGTNELFLKITNATKTNGTPNMGGIMIWILVPFMMYILLPHTVMFTIFEIGFFVQGAWGAIDQIFTNVIKNNEKLKALQETFEWRLGKLVFLIILNTIIIYFMNRYNLIPTLHIIPNVLSIKIIPITVLVLGIVMDFAVYSSDIVDGLDGLMVGIFIIISIGLTVLLGIQGQYTFIPALLIITGILLVDLYFNIPPARFWNGGPGAMPLGFAIFFIALVTNNLIPYFFMTSFIWFDMFTSMIQILAFKILKKRIFKIAPFHHNLQAKGWPSDKVVMRLWLFVTLATIVGVYIGLL